MSPEATREPGDAGPPEWKDDPEVLAEVEGYLSETQESADVEEERWVTAEEYAETVAIVRPTLRAVDDPLVDLPFTGLPPDPTVESGDEPFRLEPVDWPAVAVAGVPKMEYLNEPYLPARKRIWGVGPAESGKSIWAAWKATQLTRAGLVVVYVSQENGLEEELRRFLRMRPDFARLRLYVDQGLDLTLAEHRAELFDVSNGAALVALDTLTGCWSGDEDSNDELIAFDREVTKPLMVAGTSSLVLDHTGNPQAFTRRRGVSAPRGASSKGQKTDFLLEFRTSDDGSFRVERSKKRGTHGKEPRRYVVVDGPDDELELVESEVAEDEKIADLANELVAIVAARQPLSTSALRDAAAKELKVGTTTVDAAMKHLAAEAPARVFVEWEVIETDGGRQRAKAWRLVEDAPEPSEELW